LGTTLDYNFVFSPRPNEGMPAPSGRVATQVIFVGQTVRVGVRSMQPKTNIMLRVIKDGADVTDQVLQWTGMVNNDTVLNPEPQFAYVWSWKFIPNAAGRYQFRFVTDCDLSSSDPKDRPCPIVKVASFAAGE